MEIIDGESDKDESPHSTIVWGICWSGSAPGSGFLLGSSSRVLTLVIITKEVTIHYKYMKCQCYVERTIGLPPMFSRWILFAHVRAII